jgi:hypothetical protein
MNRRQWLLAALLSAALGCAHQQQTRFQSADEPDVEVKTVGDFTTVGNANPVAISGVGLVVNLEGTGGDAPPSSYRDFLEASLRKANVQHIKELLASANTSMVIVSAVIPPGAHKDDPLDVEISLPAHSKTTSLRGGYLMPSFLYEYNSTKNLDPNFPGANRNLLGHVLAKAEGALFTSPGHDTAALRQARIWAGARCRIDRPFGLVMNDDQQRAPVVQKITDRINETFHGHDREPLSDVAVAKTKSYLLLRVPSQYKLNVPHYLRVVRLIPFQETPRLDSPYGRRLQSQLLDPAHTITSALRLEAFGTEAVPALKTGLQSPHPLVRFASAESLAYLGSPACGEELAALVQHQPLLRAFSLTALASLDEAITRVKLRELLAAPDAVARYGAFRALHILDERDQAIQGELLNNSFWVHRAAPDAAPLVHVSTLRRAEIVLFGQEPYLVPPFSFLAGEFTIIAAPGDQQCTLSRLSLHHGNQRRQCSLKLDDVLHCMADMGCLYPETVDLLRQAEHFQCLSCPVAIDALPQGVSIEQLVNDSDLKIDEQGVLHGKAETISKSAEAADKQHVADGAGLKPLD